MFVQSEARNARPFSRTQMITNQVREKEMMSMCILRFEAHECKPTMIEIARRCKHILEADVSNDLEVVFVGLDETTSANLTEWRARHHIHTLGDWVHTLQTLLAPGSGNCPNCGLATFTDPRSIPIFCSACGANPGAVFENAGGLFNDQST